MDRNLAMYILVNSDIEMSAGKLAGQVGHVVERYMSKVIEAKMDYNCYTGHYETDGCEELVDLYYDYQETNTKKIVVKCSQTKLEDLIDKGYIFIRDNGLTELNPGTLTCLCLGIVDRNNYPEELKFIKRLRLYK